MIFNYRIFLPCLLALALSACSGGDKPPAPASATTTTPVDQTSTVSAPSVAAQIAALEASGKLPKLDRSSDIKGPDANNNGIRDDIDAWIAALPITDVQKKAAQQTARVRQAELIVDLTNKIEHDRLGVLGSRSIKCLRLLFMPDYQKGYDLSSQIEALTANTRERTMQYIAFNRAVSGSVESSVTGNTCDP